MTVEEAKAVVLARHPKADMAPHRRGSSSGVWWCTVYAAGYLRGKRLSGNHKTAAAAWLAAAHNVQRKLV